MTILLVDDGLLGLTVRRELFAGEGHSVAIAKSCAEGLDLFQATAFDAMVLDRARPDTDCGGLAERLKEIRSDTRIIMLSGKLRVPEAVVDLIDAFLVKGSNVAKLIELLQAKE